MPWSEVLANVSLYESLRCCAPLPARRAVTLSSCLNLMNIRLLSLMASGSMGLVSVISRSVSNCVLTLHISLSTAAVSFSTRAGGVFWDSIRARA